MSQGNLFFAIFPIRRFLGSSRCGRLGLSRANPADNPARTRAVITPRLTSQRAMEVPASYICPITSSIMKDPVQDPEGESMP